MVADDTELDDGGRISADDATVGDTDSARVRRVEARFRLIGGDPNPQSQVDASRRDLPVRIAGGRHNPVIGTGREITSNHGRKLELYE